MIKSRVKIYCDLCEAELSEDTAFPMMFYPFSPEEISSLMEEFSKLVPNEGIGSVLAGPLVTIATPRGHRFEFCQGCVDGFMPMLEELKQKAFRAVLNRMQRRAAKPIGSGKRPPRPLFDPDDEEE